MIRHVLAKDSSNIVKIYNHYIKKSTISFEESPVSPKEIEHRVYKVLNSNPPWLVHESDGKVTGYAYATKWSERGAYCFTLEATVYVAQEASRVGIGSSLYTALINQLKNQSIHNVIAVIALPNEASEQLHYKFGFKKAGEFKQVGYKFDSWINVAYWQLAIQGSSDGT